MQDYGWFQRVAAWSRQEVESRSQSPWCGLQRGVSVQPLAPELSRIVGAKHRGCQAPEETPEPARPGSGHLHNESRDHLLRINGLVEWFGFPSRHEHVTIEGKTFHWGNSDESRNRSDPKTFWPAGKEPKAKINNLL